MNYSDETVREMINTVRDEVRPQIEAFWKEHRLAEWTEIEALFAHRFWMEDLIRRAEIDGELALEDAWDYATEAVKILERLK